MINGLQMVNQFQGKQENIKWDIVAKLEKCSFM